MTTNISRRDFLRYVVALASEQIAGPLILTYEMAKQDARLRQPYISQVLFGLDMPMCDGVFYDGDMSFGLKYFEKLGKKFGFSREEKVLK